MNRIIVTTFVSQNDKVMNITIKLSDEEVKGVKAYLQSMQEEKVKRADIEAYIVNIVSSTLYAPQEAVSDFIDTP